ncbi:MAG TPA: YidC/Oxa1 family membrane protein insertase [Candidatus Limnocylindrales bacterium]
MIDARLAGRLPFRPRRADLLALAALAAIVVFLAACSATGSPAPSASGAAASASPSASATLPPAAHPLQPASPGADPFSFFAWVFTPVFQVLFIALVLLDRLPFSNIAIAIVLLTLIIRTILIPLYRRQLVNQKRMQLMAPELKELRKRYKDRTERMAAEQEFYKSRGVNPAGGCLPLVLQFIFLIPMYSVFSAGLTNFNPQAMVNVFGVPLVDLHCPAQPTIIDAAHGIVKPCLDTVVLGVDWSRPEVILGQPGALFSGLSLLAIISSLLQMVASRMTMPPAEASDDPNARIQRQTLLIVPLFSLVYGSILPAGLFLYWIVGTIYQIVQQYFILGLGSLFPIFGWYPEFARNHTPRFPVSIPEPRHTSKTPNARRERSADDRAVSAAKTIRQRGRQGRRGRRR